VYKPQRSEDIIVVNTPEQRTEPSKTSFEELENDDETPEVQPEPEPVPAPVTKPAEKPKKTRK
jgi:hypothetical protein